MVVGQSAWSRSTASIVFYGSNFCVRNKLFFIFIQRAVPGNDNSTTSSMFDEWQLDYLKAQHDGHFKNDCSNFEQKCPFSIFETTFG